MIRRLKDVPGRSWYRRHDRRCGHQQEEERFAKAFKDPEFCKLFADYADEISDPKNRAEQEQYIAQLEGEKKLPEGKELMRPEPGFVVKAFKRSQKAGAGTKEKMFINICQSDKLLKPVSTRSAEKGTSWTFPHALGPVRMEQDKCESLNQPLVSSFLIARIGR